MGEHGAKLMEDSTRMGVPKSTLEDVPSFVSVWGSLTKCFPTNVTSDTMEQADPEWLAYFQWCH